MSPALSRKIRKTAEGLSSGCPEPHPCVKAIHRGNGLRLAGCVVLQTLMGRFRLHSGCARPPETSERVLLSSETSSEMPKKGNPGQFRLQKSKQKTGAKRRSDLRIQKTVPKEETQKAKANIERGSPCITARAVDSGRVLEVAWLKGNEGRYCPMAPRFPLWQYVSSTNFTNGRLSKPNQSQSECAAREFQDQGVRVHVHVHDHRQGVAMLAILHQDRWAPGREGNFSSPVSLQNRPGRGTGVHRGLPVLPAPKPTDSSRQWHENRICSGETKSHGLSALQFTGCSVVASNLVGPKLSPSRPCHHGVCGISKAVCHSDSLSLSRDNCETLREKNAFCKGLMRLRQPSINPIANPSHQTMPSLTKLHVRTSTDPLRDRTHDALAPRSICSEQSQF
ncbi:hypothetical protein HCBG_08178 [Histoplasma capsulatum G186AR]|uniref:Uncharacterized protein n=1 Tax=Ajellomyces capsulatus (strain G186AR / H82 / ATCC MYA-2454 / RMSCC 2432) TaxID=447093 RepID=C0NXI6_AJECG|nr:uncharacterized protein HCBG_08178 [Histoplasma capsulatum G186AR]EEH04052.1 hypothetical protein HCBG_08178 [Histoplasma capsulatum G186AR]